VAPRSVNDAPPDVSSTSTTHTEEPTTSGGVHETALHPVTKTSQMGVHTPVRYRTVRLGVDTASVDDLHVAAGQPPHGIILTVVDLDDRDRFV